MFDHIKQVAQRSQHRLLQDTIGAVSIIVILLVGLNLPVLT